MRLHLNVRALFYGVITIAVVVLAVLGLTIYLLGFTVPASVLNSRLAQLIASRYSLRYQLDSLRIGCLRWNCPGDVNLGAFEVEFNTAETFRVRLNNTNWNRRSPLTARGLEIRSGRRPPTMLLDNLQIDPGSGRTAANGLRIGLNPNTEPSEVGRLEFDGVTKRITAAAIRLPMENRPPLDIEEVGLEGWQRSAIDGWIIFDRIDVRGVKLAFERSTNSANICGQLPASDALRRAVEPFRPVLPLFREVFLKLRVDLLRVALAIGAVILVLKLLSVLWLRRWSIRLALSIIPAAAPFAIYFFLREALPTGKLILAGAGVSIVAAILCCVFVYRRGAKWHQRWEPFAVDLASLVIMLPLLGYGYELPSIPDPPAGFQLDRIDVANVEGQSDDGVQFQIPQTSFRGVRLALPGSDNNLMRLDVSSGQVPKANISASASSRITVDDVRIDGVRAEYDPNRRQIGRVSARIRLAGLIESNRIQRELRNIEFLRGMNSRSDRLTFDLDLRASGPDGTPLISEQFPKSQNSIAVNAAVILQPQDCTASYALAARILTRPLMLTARADGDSRRVNIRAIRSLPGSPIQLGDGSGTILLNTGAAGMNLALEKVGGLLGSTQVSVDSIDMSTSLPRVGQIGSQTAAITFGTTNIRPSKGLEIQLGKASMTVVRTPNAVSVPVAFKTRIENIRIEGQDNGSIEADLPVLETSISGQTTPELIPRSFRGTVTFQVSGDSTANERLGTDKPIFINADIWKGLLDLPQQEVTFRESLLSEMSLEFPVRFELSGRLSSLFPRVTADIRTEAVLSHFEQMLGSTRVALDDARFAGRLDVDDHGASASLNYGTGWNSVELQSRPGTLCLDEVSRFDVSATGKISQIDGMSQFLPVDRPTPATCISLPSIPKAFRFRLSGVLPSGPQEYAIQLERQNGAGIRIRNIETEIQSLQIRDGRVLDIQTHANMTGIQNLQGVGGLDIRNDLRRTGGALQMKSTLLNLDGTPLLEAALSSTPTRVTLDATQQVPADQILNRLEPFLPDLRSDLGSVEPKARLTMMHAEANFEGGTLLDAAAVAQLDGGAILSADSPHLRLDIATASGNPGPAFHLNIGRPSGPQGPRPVLASIDLRGANIHSLTDQNVASDMHASLSVEANGSLFTTGQPSVRPILDSVFQVSSGLSRQASNIAELSGTKNTPQSLNNFEWNLHLEQTSPAKPLLRIENDALQFRVEGASFDASWDGADGGRDRSKIAGSAALDSTLRLSDNHLLLDALSPIELSYSPGAGTETRIESNLPIQVAFAGRLREAQQKTNTLWNEDFYSQFWREHPSRFSGTQITSPIDIREVTLGPLSLRQIRFPDKPLQVAIGYSDALQVRLPLSGRALFGGVEGELESSLTTSRTAAVLDTRLNLDLKKIQAGAFGTAGRGSHSAIVEDELDGNVSLRLDGLTMDRDTLPVLLTGNLSGDELGKIGISVHMFRSPEAANLPGVFQFSSEVQINFVNEVLNRIAKDLRLSAPPRALIYRDFALDFDVDGGQVRTNREILKLGGLQLFSSNFVDVAGEFRLHAGRPGERILLGDLMETLSGFSASTQTGGR